MDSHNLIKCPVKLMMPKVCLQENFELNIYVMTLYLWNDVYYIYM